jgi:Pentapeptide repeats (8 copies)
MRPPIQPATWILVALAIVLLAALLASILVLPPVLVGGLGLSGADLGKAQNDARGTLVAAWTGLSVAFAGVAALLTYRLSRRGQVTDRFSKAIDQIGSTSMAVRTGGLYALEQIVADSPELQWPVMETLFAFLSQYAPLDRPGVRRASYPYPAEEAVLKAPVKLLTMATDVQAALTIIALRKPGWDRKDATVNLKNLDLGDARLREAKLGKTARLKKVNFRHTHLAGAHLEGALLGGADFAAAVLVGAHFKGADLKGTQFRRADMRLVDLTGAIMDAKTDVPGANLQFASGLSQEHLQLVQWSESRPNKPGTRWPDDVVPASRPSSADDDDDQVHEDP